MADPNEVQAQGIPVEVLKRKEASWLYLLAVGALALIGVLSWFDGIFNGHLVNIQSPAQCRFWYSNHFGKFGEVACFALIDKFRDALPIATLDFVGCPSAVGRFIVPVVVNSI